MRTDQIDEDLKAIWAAYAEGRLSEEAAQAAAEAVHAERAAPEGNAAANPSKPRAGRPARREKLFGVGRPIPLDREAKVRIMHLARTLMHRTAPGRHYGQVTAKAIAVLEALLWGFHNARNGLCFPSYERIAEAAHCARSTVYEAIAALEAAGVLTWVNRLRRVREAIPGLPGVGATRVRVLRTSNAYAFTDPASTKSSKSDLPTGTAGQESNSLPERAVAAAKRLFEGCAGPASRLGERGAERLPWHGAPVVV